MQPDGVFLSNGPGDTEPVTYAIENIRKISARNRSSASAWASSSWVWPSREDLQAQVRHRGGNQPIMDLTTRRSRSQPRTMASRGHGVGEGTCGDDPHEPERRTCEGIAQDPAAFSVQYHPSRRRDRTTAGTCSSVSWT